MARRYETIVIRRTNGLEIVCVNPTTIYIKHKYGVSIYERWFVRQRGFYLKNWQPFRRALTDQRHLDLQKVNQLAEKYEISATGTKTLPDLTDKTIKVLPEWGRNRNVHN